MNCALVRSPMITMSKEKGNALFIILIAVILFAALSYAVTQSGRSSGGVDKEKRHLYAARLTEIGQYLQIQTERMVLSGTPVENIVLHTGDQKTPCTSGVNCLFTPEGGGATFPELPPLEVIQKGNTFYPTHISLFDKTQNAATKTGVAGGQTIVFLIIRSINQATCEKINEGLGVASFLPDNLVTNLDNGIVAHISGQRVGCVKTNGGEGYNYYHVLATP